LNDFVHGSSALDMTNQLYHNWMFQVGQGLHQGGQDGQENDSRLTLRKSPTARSQAFYPKSLAS
jgi:hypothetical protein